MSITKKQKQVLDYISSYTDDYGYAPTQNEIKEHFGLKSLGSVQRYIKYLTDAGYLVADQHARRGLLVAGKQNQSDDTQEFEIPLLGAVAAGNPIEAIENPSEMLAIPPDLLKKGGQMFALTVEGDSMIEDGILEGDYVIIKGQNTAKNGETVVAVIDGEATLKKYIPKKNKIELHPANHRLKPIIVGPDQEDFKLVGVLVGLIRQY
tara:strand:- start:18065 stop:18685 length:621 start_codon:yes stop_codon:yes gene_type:complete